MPSPNQTPPYPLRMPDELRTQLTELSKANGRSLNAEIVAILQAAVDGRPASFDMEQFAEDLAERLSKKLKAK